MKSDKKKSKSVALYQQDWDRVEQRVSESSFANRSAYIENLILRDLEGRRSPEPLSNSIIEDLAATYLSVYDVKKFNLKAKLADMDQQQMVQDWLHQIANSSCPEQEHLMVAEDSKEYPATTTPPKPPTKKTKKGA